MQIVSTKKAKKFIEGLRSNDAEKTQKMLASLEEQGYRLSINTEAFNEHKGLRALRIRSSERWIRIFYCFAGDRIVLLSGFFKKSNETPKRERELAYRLLLEVKGM